MLDNDTRVPSQSVARIDHLVAEEARSRPDSTAVSASGVRVTYAQLDAYADDVASRLKKSGIRPGSRVAVTVPRSVAYPAAVLGVLKAGCCYVPVDQGYPTERQQFILADSQAGAILAPADDPGAAQRWPPDLCIHPTGEQDLDGRARAQPASLAAPDAEVYVMYTSGSTGTPKGVVVEHRNILSLVLGDKRIRVGPDERVALFAPVSFDASTFELWNTLCGGGELVVLPGGGESVAGLGRDLVEARPDWLFLTSGLFHLLMEYEPQSLDAVGTVITGGDVLSPRHVAQAAARGKTTIYAAYGPTETTTFASLYRVDASTPVDRVPIGSPLAGVRIYVLDRHQRPVAPGTVGEVYIGGSGVATGYLDRAELTAARFMADPFSGDPDARMYRTGDLGRERGDGDFEFHGRVDRQVKIRGHRVEPSEIEAVLGTHPEVSTAAVTAVEDGVNLKRLVAYFVPTTSGDLSVSELRAWLTDRLPAYMEPSTFVPMETMPLDPNGKIDRRRLPHPWKVRDKLADLPPYRSPGNDLERRIAIIWAESLGLDRVGLDDDFTALGGDSLHSVEMLARLKRAGLSVSALDFFRYPTVGELADVYQEART